MFDIGKYDNLIEDYRNVITNTLLSNETIISLLSKDTLGIEDADSLLWDRIIPQQYVPDTITDTGSYILYDIDENIISRQDKTYIELPIYFWVFTHRKSPTYKSRLCNDILVREIKSMFSEKDLLGLANVHFISNRIQYNISNKYAGRLLTFRVTDWSDKVRLKNE